MTASRYPRSRPVTITTTEVREVKVTTLANGDEHALVRWVGAKSLYWKSLPVSRARAALRVGRLTFGGFEGPVVAARDEKAAA